MSALLFKFFNLRAGEGTGALLFASLGFLWALGASLALKMGDALFYLYLGTEALPHAFTIRALFSFGIVLFFLYGITSFRIKNIFLFSLSIGIFIFSLFNLGFFLNVGPEQRWFWYALKIFSNLFLLALITNFWSFIDQYYGLKKVKRLYGLLNASVFIGFATAGLILSHSLFSVSTLYLFVTLCISLTLYFVSYISRHYHPIAHDPSPLEERKITPSFSLSTLAKGIITNPFALALIFCNICIQILSVITEYHYMLSFERLFHPDSSAPIIEASSEGLTIFLGQCTTWISIANIAFGTMIYGRLIQKFGVKKILFITPLSFFLYFAEAPLYCSSLLLPIFGFIIVEGILYGIDDNNFNILINTVPPKYKYQARVASESFFDPIGLLIGSLILLVPNTDYLFLGLGTSIVFILASLILSFYYSEEHAPQERLTIGKEKIAEM